VLFSLEGVVVVYDKQPITVVVFSKSCCPIMKTGKDKHIMQIK